MPLNRQNLSIKNTISTAFLEAEYKQIDRFYPEGKEIQVLEATPC